MLINHVYWLAGLLEGEGCFHPNVGRSTVVTLAMTDRDTVARAATLLGGPVGVRVKGRTITGKTVYVTQVYGSRAASWMMTIYSLMGVRRRKKILECLAKWRSQAIAAGDRATCAFGHPFTTVKRGVGSRRKCLICAAARNRKYLARAAAGLVHPPSGIGRCGHALDAPDPSCRTCAVREAGRRFRALHRRSHH